jgi:hypothetical protein
VLARAQTIDLKGISVTALVEQLVAALSKAGRKMPRKLAGTNRLRQDLH